MSNRLRLKHQVFIYVVVTALIVAAVAILLPWGNRMYPVSGNAHAGTGTDASGVVPVLLAMVTILTVTQILGRILHYVNQPPVIGEMLGGILLGRSALGLFFPELQKMLIPESVYPFIG